MSEYRDIKDKIRRQIWAEMERLNIARFPRPVFGRIPNFIGAEKAAENLRKLPEWRKSHIIFVNPDSPQYRVRLNALLDGKKVIMASPRIRKGFLLLDPEKIPHHEFARAITIRGAFKFGRSIHPSELRIDMKVTGSVAVDTKGGRIGKGHGFSDIEYGILREWGAIDEDTLIVTTVHDIQIVENIPMSEHDMPVDIIITPSKVIRVKRVYRRPQGINWETILKEYIREIPLLAELWQKKIRKNNDWLSS